MSQVDLSTPDWNITDFPQRLTQLGMARKIAQTRVAELLGVSPRVYTRWENGHATRYLALVSKSRASSMSVSMKRSGVRRVTAEV